MSDVAQPIDVQTLMTRCMGEIDFAAEIVRDFLQTSDQELAQLDGLLNQQQLTTLAQEAHRLKGTAATVAAEPLAAKLVEVENIAKAGDPEALRDKLDDLKAEFRRVKEFATARIF